jgi:hypothetical protein
VLLIKRIDGMHRALKFFNFRRPGDNAGDLSFGYACSERSASPDSQLEDEFDFAVLTFGAAFDSVGV